MLATVIGNAWFVAHRYLIQQLVDLVFWASNSHGGPKRKETKYHLGIAEHVWKFFTADVPEDIRQHLRFRNAGIILMYITAEVAFLAISIAEQGSIIALNRRWFVMIAVVILVGAIWQNYLTRRLEECVANRSTTRLQPTAEKHVG